MAIEKYVTHAIVLDAYEQGEHDKAYKVYTREFGLLICHAKSIRKLESKLRSHMLPRSVSLVTLVKGKEVWRLVGAENEKIDLPLVNDVTTLLKRFIRGEGTNKVLYDRIIAFFESATQYDEQTSRLLLYYVLLVELGYADAEVIGARDIYQYHLFTINDLYTHLLLNKKEVRSHVQAVLKEMQL